MRREDEMVESREDMEGEMKDKGCGARVCIAAISERVPIAQHSLVFFPSFLSSLPSSSLL